MHGQACVKTEARPACTFVGGDVPPAKMFVLDIQNLMQGDWRVGRWLGGAWWWVGSGSVGRICVGNSA